MRCSLFIVFLSLFSCTFAQIDSDLPPPDTTVLDSNVQYVLPTIIDEDPKEPFDNLISIDNEDIGVVGSAPLPEAEIIAELNRPLNLQNYSPKVREVVEVGQAAAIKILGEKNMQLHLRLYRDRLEILESIYQKRGEAFDDGYMGALLYYTIVYQGHVLDVLTFAVQDGKMMEEYWEKTANTLKAYRELFDGKLSVSPDTALQRVFGNDKPLDVNIHLRYAEHSGDLRIPQNSPYKRPKIWWYIWQNGCTICQEGEVDANNIENYLLEEVDRRKRRW